MLFTPHDPTFADPQPILLDISWLEMLKMLSQFMPMGLVLWARSIGQPLAAIPNFVIAMWLGELLYVDTDVYYFATIGAIRHIGEIFPGKGLLVLWYIFCLTGTK